MELTLTLPCAVLLHEVLLTPHAATLVSCPSAVALELGVEGGQLSPVTGPVPTAGLSRVRLLLPRPTVASVVVVRWVLTRQWKGMVGFGGVWEGDWWFQKDTIFLKIKCPHSLHQAVPASKGLKNLL